MVRDLDTGMIPNWWPLLSEQGTGIPPRLIVSVLRQMAGHFFPLLATDAKASGEPGT